MADRTLPDLTGQTFGRLIVVAAAPPAPRNQRQWRCECSCGNATPVVYTTGRLNSGEVRSCGCLMRTNQHRNYRRRLGSPVAAMRTIVTIDDFDDLDL